MPLTVKTIEAAKPTDKAYKIYDGGGLHLGHSAGGHLTAMMLTVDWQTLGLAAGAPPFRHELSISGLFDIALLMHTAFSCAVATYGIRGKKSQSDFTYSPSKWHAIQRCWW